MNKNLDAVKNSLLRENGNRPHVIGETTIKVEDNALMVLENDIYILVENAPENVQDFPDPVLPRIAKWLLKKLLTSTFIL